ncbi:MAG: M28 family peptidase [Armatimonadetes bacterium]|nr:M28 family peptidase [Armatimonadota bacterium]
MRAMALRIVRMLALLTLVVTPCAALSISQVVDEISLTSYTAYLAGDDFLYTHLGDSRGLGKPQHDLARDNIYNEFASFGLTTELDSFHWYNSGNTYYDGVNVVGVLPGLKRPNDLYIIGAHYDSVSVAPGADDNGSGVAAVLECARVLSQYSFDATLVFIAFDCEEVGLVGSRWWVHDNPGANVLGMLSLDMIAFNYTDDPNTKDRVFVLGPSTGGYAALKQAFADAVNQYGNGVIPVQYTAVSNSDHYPFQQAGYASALVIERGYSYNTNYHKSTDAVESELYGRPYIDTWFAHGITRATAGWLATEANLNVPEPGTVALVLLGLGLLGVKVLRRRG